MRRHGDCVRPERLRTDLRDHRFEALPHRCAAGDDFDLTIGVHVHPRAIGRPETYTDRDNPGPAGDPAPPGPGVIALLTALALVGAGVLLIAPRWLRGR